VIFKNVGAGLCARPLTISFLKNAIIRIAEFKAPSNRMKIIKSFCRGTRPRGAWCPRRPFGPSRELLNCSSQLFAQCLNLSYELRAKSQELTQRVPLGRLIYTKYSAI